MMFPPPPVQGLGTIGGFKLQVEDRARPRLRRTDDATQAFMGALQQGAGARRGLLHVSGQRAAALC